MFVKGVSIQVNTVTEDLTTRDLNIWPDITMDELAVFMKEEMHKASELGGTPTSMTVIITFNNG